MIPKDQTLKRIFVYPELHFTDESCALCFMDLSAVNNFID